MTSQADPWHPANLITLSTLAAEGLGNGDIDTLAQQLGDNVIIDDIGIRCTTRATARVLITERAAAQAQHRAREDARTRELARITAERSQIVRDRVRALQQRDSTGDPLADMKRTDIEDNWERAAAQREELARSERTGRLPYHPIRDNQE